MTDLAEAAPAWVDASCTAQGLPVRLADAAVLARVAGRTPRPTAGGRPAARLPLRPARPG